MEGSRPHGQYLRLKVPTKDSKSSPSPRLSKLLIAASKPIYEEFATTVPGGQELIDTVQGLADGS